MVNCRILFGFSVLLALFMGNAVWGQSSNASYSVNGDSSSWGRSSEQAGIVWTSTEMRKDVASAAPMLDFERLPSEVIEDGDPFQEASSAFQTDEEEKDEPELDELDLDEPDMDESEKEDDELEGELEPSRSLSVQSSTIEAINPLRRPMSALSIDVRDLMGETPGDESNRFTDQSVEQWSTFAPQPTAYAWAAPNIRYQPLYFENVPLERYGQTRGPWREVVRGSVHYFQSLVLLPYHAAIDCPKSCDHPLGFCRPGDSTQAVRQLQWWGR